MTLTGHKDGDDASTGTSYLEIARVLMDHGAQTNEDLRELWSRIVFNVLVSNTDDHSRNHGFILRSVAPFFRLKAKTADEIVESSQAIVKQWRKIARRLALSARACDRMTPAFRLAG